MNIHNFDNVCIFIIFILKIKKIYLLIFIVKLQRFSIKKDFDQKARYQPIVACLKDYGYRNAIFIGSQVLTKPLQTWFSIGTLILEYSVL